MWRYNFQRRPCHGYPDVDQHEIDRSLDLTERLAQIALAEVDEIAQAGFVEKISRCLHLLRLVFGTDHDAAATRSTHIVPHRRSQVERRDAIGSADLDDQASVDGPAEVVAELRLIAIKRIDLIGEESLGQRSLLISGGLPLYPVRHSARGPRMSVPRCVRAAGPADSPGSGSLRIVVFNFSGIRGRPFGFRRHDRAWAVRRNAN